MNKRFFFIIAMFLGSIFIYGQSNKIESVFDFERQEGDKYYYGKGVEQDYEKALYWYTRLAERGRRYAQLMLASMYYNGQGTNKDINTSIYWYTKAGNGGDGGAWSKLGDIYLDFKNYTEALYCFQKATKETILNKISKPRLYALYRVGNFYEYGWGVDKNIEEAKVWYKLSANRGFDLAIKKLKDIDDSLKSNNNLARLTWLSSTNETFNKSYSLEIGVNSSSKVEEVYIYINDEPLRGIFSVKDNGFTSKVERLLSLGIGENQIKVKVKNASGWSSIEKTITVSEVKKLSDDKRLALIIGNSNYRKIGSLLNTTNDANDVADKLYKLGFDTIKVLDLTKDKMISILNLYSNKAKKYDVVLFYYAGHGVRCNTTNYLIPIDADLPNEESVKDKCINVNSVLNYMEKSNNRMKILIIDACRNNPFKFSSHRGLYEVGLSHMTAPEGTFIAFSTSPGCTASDGKLGQRNSPYTSVLLEMFEKPNISLTDFFQEVLLKVAKQTNDEQIPWVSNAVRGNFYFNIQ